MSIAINAANEHWNIVINIRFFVFLFCVDNKNEMQTFFFKKNTIINLIVIQRYHQRERNRKMPISDWIETKNWEILCHIYSENWLGIKRTLNVSRKWIKYLNVFVNRWKYMTRYNASEAYKSIKWNCFNQFRFIVDRMMGARHMQMNWCNHDHVAYVEKAIKKIEEKMLNQSIVKNTYTYTGWNMNWFRQLLDIILLKWAENVRAKWRKRIVYIIWQ